MLVRSTRYTPRDCNQPLVFVLLTQYWTPVSHFRSSFLLVQDILVTFPSFTLNSKSVVVPSLKKCLTLLHSHSCSTIMASEAVQLPQIELFHRVMELPMIELALSKSASTYSRVKESHQLVYWALSSAEASLTNATRQAVPIAAPIAKRLENSIHLVDHTLCKGLDKIEEKVPIVKERPEQILESAYTLAMQTVQPAVSKIAYANDLLTTQAACLKTLSWNKANEILGTQFGTAALQGLDSTAAIADKLIDQYFPAAEAEEEMAAPVSIEDDKLLHTVQTLGRLSNKAARRVYANVSQHLKTISADDLKEYVSHIVAILHLTQYLHAINEKVQALTTPKENQSQNPAA